MGETDGQNEIQQNVEHQPNSDNYYSLPFNTNNISKSWLHGRCPCSGKAHAGNSAQYQNISLFS